MKRVRATILGGVIYEGNYEQAVAQRDANMGGARPAGSLPGGAEATTETQTK